MRVTGLTATTFDHLQLDAGVLLRNFDYSTAKTAAELKALIAAAINSPDHWIGATRGGGTYECTPTTREVEADGMRMSFKGSTRNDGWSIKIKTTILEMTGDNLKMAIGAADATTDGKITKIIPHSDFEDDDYLENIVWIGERSKDSYMLIKIDNALSVGGMTLTYTDKGEGTVPLELSAHCASVDDQDAPTEILLIDAAA